MKRRIIWNLGDSSPQWSYLVINIWGSGSMQIDTGFSVSSAMVTFARTYLDKILDTYGNTSDLRLYVESVNETGFVIAYENIPENIPLEINYMAM